MTMFYYVLCTWSHLSVLSYSPQVALKIMVPKLRSPTEKVALLALTVSLGIPLVGLNL